MFMYTITLEFEDGALYRFHQDEDEYSRLTPGVWTPPYPNTREDSQVFGLLEAWRQYPEGPIFCLLEEHGEPVKVTIAEHSEPTEAIYRFHWDCGRMGEIDGIFVAQKSEINAAIGQEVYLGEVLGKHSEVYGTLTQEDLTLISDNPQVVAIAKSHEMTSGYNPLDYIEE